MNIIATIAFSHSHKWDATLRNLYGVEIESRCKCGKYRHHLFEDARLDSDDQWRDGYHPLRDREEPRYTDAMRAYARGEHE